MKKLFLVCLWCGWILWSKSGGVWDAFKGFSTEEDCKAYAQALQSIPGPFYATCFPSDFDPREKK